MEVLEHVDNPAAFLRTCAKLVKVLLIMLHIVSHVNSPSLQPGGHLFLSTIARTPFSYISTILVAEGLLGLVSKGTHTHSKFIQPSEIVRFFHSAPASLSEPTGTPDALSAEGTKGLRWITRLHNGEPTRTEAEVRHMVFNPLSGTWTVLPRATILPRTMECNYLFWARKPPDQ
jgi:2-polyprenyl-6-hydroxyphenyl methylase/3-demethylubiquinone-9 3-methyltransferase